MPVADGNAAEFRDSSRYSGISDEARDQLPYLQCVPYARQISGIQIYGDALTWWEQAEGRYAKGRKPKPGAVMSFAPYGRMELGHVAAVSRVIDSRTVLLRHANWSPIDGRRGQIEDDVRAVDVSERNDWSQVRVWYAPIGNLGTTAWPVNGFIYPDKPGRQNGFTLLAAKPVSAPASVPASVPASIKAKAADAPKSPKALVGADFLKGIRPEVDTKAAPARRHLASNYSASGTTPRKSGSIQASASRQAMSNDPIGRIIAAKTR